LDLGPPEPERAGSIRANFLDSSGTAFFELTLHAISSFGHSSPEHSISRASISPNALKVLYRLKEAGYQRFSSAAPCAICSSASDRRTSMWQPTHCRGREAAVSQLSAHRSPLSPGACAFRQRDHRGRDLSGGRGAGARGSPDDAADGAPEEAARAPWRVARSRRLHRARSSRAGADRPRAGADSEHRAFDITGRILRDNMYGSIEEDVWRRDFAANGLYYNIADLSIWISSTV